MSETTPDDPAGRRAGGAGHPTPVFGVPASAFRRFRATVLSPDDAVRRGAEPPVHPTAYRPDRLILPGAEIEEAKSAGFGAGATGVGTIQEALASLF